MKHAAYILPILLLAACEQETPSAPAEKGPPPPPPYQIRGELPSGDRLAAGRSGKALFEVHCGYCHLAGGMGTNLLIKQRMMAGDPPEKGLLANRTDLTPDYVKAVVRSGKNAMPAQTRVDITNAELDSVATYLGKAK
ncbi:MAG: cytochrome c [Novosphingobium sp.]